MSAQNVGKLTLLLSIVAGAPETSAEFGPGEAAARHQPGPSGERPAGEKADFKVLFWYRRADPLATFKYQVYDVRKGEYTSAVETWIKDLRTRYPAFTAFVRNVDLGVETGKTDSLKVGAVIKRELTVAAALSGVIIGRPIIASERPFELLHSSGPSVNRRSGAVSTDRSFLNPSPTPFPVPVPYPRPHP